MICKHNHLISILPKYKIICPNHNHLIQKKEDETIIESFNNMLIKIEDFSNLINMKNNYLKLRKETIIFLKEITSQFCLCDRTFHLALTLLDKIFLKIDNTRFIQSISMFCIIFAAKFVEEDTYKANLIQQTYSKFFSENYLSDEFYLLNLLDYNFNITTNYDILEYFLNYKLLYFKDEKKIFEKCSKKFSVYHLAIEYLNSLIEKNIILTLNPIQISFGIIQLIRKRIGLNPFRTELYQEFGYFKKDEFMNKGYEIFMKIFYKKKNKGIENKERENKCLSDKKNNKDMNEKNEIVQDENINIMSLIRKVKTL